MGLQARREKGIEAIAKLWLLGFQVAELEFCNSLNGMLDGLTGLRPAGRQARWA